MEFLLLDFSIKEMDKLYEVQAIYNEIRFSPRTPLETRQNRAHALINKHLTFEDCQAACTLLQLSNSSMECDQTASPMVLRSGKVVGVHDVSAETSVAPRKLPLTSMQLRSGKYVGRRHSERLNKLC